MLLHAPPPPLPRQCVCLQRRHMPNTEIFLSFTSFSSKHQQLLLALLWKAMRQPQALSPLWAGGTQQGG